MIGFLPRQVDDEILWSTLSRAADCSGGLVSDLIRQYPRLLNLQLPGSLAALEFLVGEDDWAAEETFLRRTIYPYFSSLPTQFYDSLQSAACHENERSPSTLALNLLGKIRCSHRVFFCRACKTDAEEKYGFCYLKIEHQLPGVRFCTTHNCWLEEAVNTSPVDLSFSCLDGDTRSASSLGLSEKLSKFIAYRSEAVLNGKQPINNRERLFLQMRELGWISENGTLISNRLLENWNREYSHPALEFGVVANFDSQWIKHLLRRLARVGSAVHPLWQMLLEKLVTDAVGSNPQFNLFGDRRGGRIECPNPLCDDVSSVYLGEDHECPRCGYKIWVSRKRVAVGKILDRGAIWKKELLRLLEEEMPLKKIAKQLAASPTNIKREAAELGYRARWKKPPERIDIKPSFEKLVNYRKSWIALRRLEPQLGRKALRSKSPVVWKWLHRNDRAWLESHSPVAKTRWSRPDDLF